MKIGWFFVVALCCWGVSVAAEEMVLTTYYPAPAGRYVNVNVAGTLTGAAATVTGTVMGSRLTASGENPEISLFRNGTRLFRVDGGGNVTGATAAFTGNVRVGADLSVAGAITANGNIVSSGVLWSQGGVSTAGSIKASGTVSAVGNMSANDYYIKSKKRWVSQAPSLGSSYFSGGDFTDHDCPSGYVMTGVRDFYEDNKDGNRHFPKIKCSKLK